MATYGGGLFQTGSAGIVYVSNSRVEGNSAVISGSYGGQGGGLYVDGSVSLNSTDMVSNTAASDGGGLTVWSGTAFTEGGSVTGNRAGGNGGGINVNNSVTISGTLIANNAAGQNGGGLLQWNTGKTVALVNARFEGNQAKQQGGGLWTKSNTNIWGSAFSHNTVNPASSSDVYGGGVYAANGEVTINGVVFSQNTVDSGGSGNVYGAGVYATGGDVTVNGATFEANRAICQYCPHNAGGGLYAENLTSATVKNSHFVSNNAWNGAGISSNIGPLQVEDSLFISNTGGYGAGISASQVTILRSSFTNNSATNYGGAVSCGGSLRLYQARLSGNRAQSGGAVWANGIFDAANVLLADNQASLPGAAMRLENSVQRSLSHVTIASATQAKSPAVYMKAGGLTLLNTIIVSHTAGIRLDAGTLSQDYGLYFNVTNTVTGTLGGVQNGQHMWYNIDPQFVRSAAGDYHLGPNSPAIDHGKDAGISVDLDGDPRPLGAGYDIGMDEFVSRRLVFLPLLSR